ncbi:MAG: UDP-2,3-diacylglucosamine diphosphatase [Gammaproteobacteria bacterium]|nr:UDP-2,3-diacylglucosamine diphosphatase [Gammaproteobacteria bacterium]
MNRQWFISDLHLAEERPETIALFERFLSEFPQPGDRVFILGDLFDVWVGDDDDSAIADRIRADLRGLTRRKVELLVQQGNRDFAMGKRLMREVAARLLPDTHVANVAGQPTLLMHGDLLCTDDVEYQKTRKRFRNPIFQWLMLRKSLAARNRIADDIRRRSRERKALKSENIMDVNADTVVDYLRRFRVRQLIHGHTHRPARHAIRLPDGSDAWRLVLPEWHHDHAAAWVDDGKALQRVVLAGD